MINRTQTVASFVSVAMAATLLGAFVATQVQRPETAQAREADTVQAEARPAGARSIGLDTFRDIAKRENAGVVNINTEKLVRRSGNPFRDFLGDEADRLFPPQRPGQGQRRQRLTNLGSGFVIDKAGYILTNRHVIDGADEISVTFPGGSKTYDAKVVGKDARTDVALLKIEPTGDLHPLELGDSSEVEVGEWVMAVGNPFGLGGNSVTVGVVSYMGRDIPSQLVQNTSVEMIQTDAAINPGNSGGPLINARGQVIGINTMIVTGGQQQSAGVGFSVPINVAKEILPQLREKGRVVRGWLGLTIEPNREDLAKTLGMKEATGAVVTQVTEDSPAAKAGLRAEDVVVAADGRKIGDNSDLSQYIASRAPGNTVKLDVWSRGAEKQVAVVLGTFPDTTDDDQASEAPRGRLGMTLQDLNPRLADQFDLPAGTKGPVVVDVETGEPAEKAGLRPGDVVVSVNGNAVANVAEFEKQIDSARKDGAARLRVIGDRQVFRIVVLKLS
jgi:serine protease Do